MAGNRQQIDVQQIYHHRNFSDTLGGIRVHQDISAMADFGNLTNRLNGPHFIVGLHHADQSRIGSQRCPNIGRADKSMFVTTDNRDIVTDPFEERGWRCDRWVFNRTDDHVTIADVALEHDSLNRKVIAFGAATGKHDLS